MYFYLYIMSLYYFLEVLSKATWFKSLMMLTIYYIGLWIQMMTQMELRKFLVYIFR